MKALSLALLLMATMAFVMSGCSDRVDSVVAPLSDQSLSRSADLTASSLGKVAPSLHSIAGNVHAYYRLNSATHGKQWDVFGNFTFSAKLDQDNIATGNFRLKNIGPTTPEMFFPNHSGKVVQLMIEEDPELGTMAKIMYQATEGAELMEIFGPTPIGCIVVIDGGEGKNALPDCVSYWMAIDTPEVMAAMGFYEMTAGQFLQNIEFYSGVPHGIRAVDNGNIQVR